MTGKPSTLDDLFATEEQRTRDQIAREDRDGTTTRRAAERAARLAEEIRVDIERGIRDADGNYIEQPEADEDDETETDEDEE